MPNLKGMRRLLPTLVLMALVAPAIAKAEPQSSAFSTAGWDIVLKHVKDGKVDYLPIKGNPLALTSYFSYVATANLSAMSDDEAKAFWINTYNAAVVRLILEHYPVKSIMDITGAFDLPLVEFGDEKLSLNQIEKEKLFKKFPDARLHFALVCAAISCPALRAEAYADEWETIPLVDGTKLSNQRVSLDAQLDDASAGFIQDATKNQFDPSTGTLRLSQIFNWYAKDFAAYADLFKEMLGGYSAEQAGVLGFLLKYRMPGLEAHLAAKEPVKIEYLEYDWGLNDAK